MKEEIAWTVVVFGGIVLLILGTAMGYALINNVWGITLGAGAGALMVCGLIYVFEQMKWLK